MSASESGYDDSMNITKELNKKIARTYSLETASYVSITIGDLIYDVLRVDPRVLEGVDFSRKQDLSNVFKFGKQEISERATKSSESLESLHDNYTGYTFERVIGMNYQKRGAEVVYPEKSNQTGWDIMINGEKFQIKTQEKGINLIEDHFEKHPYRVIANSEAAEKFVEKYPEKSHLIINSGIEHDYSKNLVAESTEAGVEVMEDNKFFGSAIPEILGIVSIISFGKNFMYWVEGKTDIKTAFKNIAIDSVGRFAGAGIGAKLGSFLLPPLGTIIGGAAGFFMGGSIVNELKLEKYCRNEIKSIEKNMDEYLKKTISIMEKNKKTFEKKEKYLKKKMKKMSDALAIAVKKDNLNSAKQFHDFMMKKLNEEKELKKEVLEMLKSLLRKTAKGYRRFVELIPQREGYRKNNGTDTELFYNEYALETIELASEGGVGPEFVPWEAERLFDSVKKFSKKLKKHGI